MSTAVLLQACLRAKEPAALCTLVGPLCYQVCAAVLFKGCPRAAELAALCALPDQSPEALVSLQAFIRSEGLATVLAFEEGGLQVDEKVLTECLL